MLSVRQSHHYAGVACSQLATTWNPQVHACCGLTICACHSIARVVALVATMKPVRAFCAWRPRWPGVALWRPFSCRVCQGRAALTSRSLGTFRCVCGSSLLPRVLSAASDSLADRHSHQGVDTRRDTTARGTCKVGEVCVGVKVLKQHTGLATRLYTVNFGALGFYYDPNQHLARSACDVIVDPVPCASSISWYACLAVLYGMSNASQNAVSATYLFSGIHTRRLSQRLRP